MYVCGNKIEGLVVLINGWVLFKTDSFWHSSVLQFFHINGGFSMKKMLFGTIVVIALTSILSADVQDIHENNLLQELKRLSCAIAILAYPSEYCENTE